jgi:RNA polymerase sigma-32 factor
MLIIQSSARASISRIVNDGATDMGVEGQFAALSARLRSEPAFDKAGRGKGYLYDIRRFALLERDKEYELAKRWRKHGDLDAANQLITSHLRLAAKIAMGYRGYGLPVSDIISEGNVGLMQALNRFEPERGFRFATYAIWWIRASIHDYILRSWSLVKIGTTANQKKLFFKLRSAKSKIAALDTGDLHPDQVALIASTLDVADQDVVDMNRRLGGDKPIDAPIHDDGEAGELQDHLVDQSPSPEAILVEQDENDYKRKALIAAMDVLDDRERCIFEARHLVDEPLTLEDLAAKFKVSRERIRQIDVRAFEKVRKAAKKLAVRAAAADAGSLVCLRASWNPVHARTCVKTSDERLVSDSASSSETRANARASRA